MNNYLNSCQSEFWKEIFEKELEYILRKLEGYKNVLSVGCGPAVIERGLQENGFNVTGLDVSRIALEGAPDNIRRVVGSAEDMEFNPGSFDAVIYVASLQFIDNYAKALQETERVLKPNGKLLAMLLNPGSEFFSGKKGQTDSYVNRIKHPYISPIEEAVRRFFDDVKIEYYLGIQNNEIFKSNNPNLAALYIIQGKRR